jgi:hypothetical protein
LHVREEDLMGSSQQSRQRKQAAEKASAEGRAEKLKSSR